MDTKSLDGVLRVCVCVCVCVRVCYVHMCGSVHCVART